MKRLVMILVLACCAVARAGELRMGGVINADTAVTVTGTQSNLIATAWQNPASATNWTWTSDGTQITLTGYSGPADVVIPDVLDNLPVTGFGTIFFNTAITSISGGENVKTFGALYGPNLTSVELKSATHLEDQGLAHNTNLVSVLLPSLTHVGEVAFMGGPTSKLTSLNLPNVTSLGGNGRLAFSFLPNLTAIYWGKNAPAEDPEATIFEDTPNVTNYVTNPTATGWGAIWNGRPVVRLHGYFDGVTVGGTNLTDLLDGKLGTNATPGSIGAVSLTGDITRTGTLGGSNAVLSTDYMTLNQGLSLLGGRSVWYMHGGFDSTVTWARATKIDTPTTNWTITIANATAGMYGPAWVITNLTGTVIKDGVISISGIGSSFNTGSSRSASYKWEAYVTNTITDGGMPEWSDQGSVKVLTGTADYVPMTIAILIPTNLPVGSALVLRPKVTSANNTPTITITGGANSLSSVSLPTGLEANLGTRGATSIIVGSANSYDETTRALTVAAVSNTPVGIAAAGGIVTNTAINLGTNHLTVTTIKPVTNSTTAIQITKADGTNRVVTIDTLNNRVGFGMTPDVNFGVSFGANFWANGQSKATGLAASPSSTGYDLVSLRYDGAYGNINAYNNATRVIYLDANPAKRSYFNVVNFGFGTTNPTERVHVNGSAIIETNLTVNGSATVGGLQVATVEQVVTGAVVTVSSGNRYFFTTATNVTLTASLTGGQVINYIALRNTATNSVTAIGDAGWKWTGGAMTNTIPASTMMTFGFACNPFTGVTNAYATAASVN